jgi:hypothetical protein
MAVKLIIAPEAEKDIVEAYDWYEGRRSGLGEEFLSCLDACIESIQRTPEIYSIVHETYRRGWYAVFPLQSFMNMKKTGYLYTVFLPPLVIRINGVNVFRR